MRDARYRMQDAGYSNMSVQITIPSNIPAGSDVY